MTAIVAFYATIPLKTYRQHMEHINVVVHITVCIVTYFRKKQKPLHSITTVYDVEWKFPDQSII